MIGLFGILIGVLLGVLGCLWVADLVLWMESLFGVTFLNTEVYPIDYIPVDLRWSDVLKVSLAAVLLNLLATLYPALRASRSGASRRVALSSSRGLSRWSVTQWF